MAEPTRDQRTLQDAAIDSALDRSLGKPQTEGPLKQQWDDDLEAELEAAMAGFDAEALSVGGGPRRDRSERNGPDGKGQRGQEEQKGLRTGLVISVRGKSVFVDLGAKSEGVVPIDQFGENVPAVGDMIEVVPDRFDPAEGILLLSLKGASVSASWENLKKGLIVEAKVTKVNKGGVEVEVDGIRGFLPMGQIEIGRVEDASIYINQKFKVVVTEANQREKNLVVSRREILEAERAEKREQTWKTLEEGQIHKGVVRSVKDFGAFVDIGGVDGLLHISDMSWVRLSDFQDLIKVGQEVEVKVLKVDRVTNKVSFGLKQLTASPWETVDDRFSQGETVPGKVTRLMEFGAFVELEPGIEGLIHVTELSPTRVRKISDIVKPGQDVEVRILKIDSEDKKISLSLRPLPNAPAAPEPEEEEEDLPIIPAKERKVPLKGGLTGPPA
jgi:ribosomal protein S1